MKNLACLLLLSLLCAWAKAQSVTDSPEWKKLILSLENENWADANQLSLQCLQEVPASEKEDALGSMLRYMVIYSESGLMNMGTVTQEQAIDKVKQYVGHNLLLPAHPLTLKFAFNSIEMNDDKSTDTLVVCASNRQATNIHCFDYVVLKDKWPEDDFKKNVGKMFRLGGKLESIKAEGHMVQRFKLIIDDATRQSVDN
jgi:hypothetical protein